MILSILSVLSPIRGKVLALFLLCPSWPVSEALEEKLVQGFMPGPYQKSIYLGLNQFEHFFSSVGVFLTEALVLLHSRLANDPGASLQLLLSRGKDCRCPQERSLFLAEKIPPIPPTPIYMGPSHLKTNEHLHCSWLILTVPGEGSERSFSCCPFRKGLCCIWRYLLSVAKVKYMRSGVCCLRK